MNYKDEAALREESEEGRRLGFDGKVRDLPPGGADRKQAIHPAQVDIIHKAFAPSESGKSLMAILAKVDIDRAQKVKETFEASERDGKGAYGLEGVMIDAPVYKQVSARCDLKPKDRH